MHSLNGLTGTPTDFQKALQSGDVGEALDKSNHYLDGIVHKIVVWCQGDGKDLITTIKQLAYYALGALSIIYMLPATVTGALIGAVAGKEFVGEEEGFLTQVGATVSNLMTESAEEDKKHLGSRAALATLLGLGAIYMAPSVTGFMWGAHAGASLREMLLPSKQAVAD